MKKAVSKSLHSSHRSTKGLEFNYKFKRFILIAFSVILFLVLYLFETASTWLRVLSTVGVLFLFYFMDHFFDINFRKRHYFFFFLIVVTGFLLSPLYFIYPQYDKIQHFFQPMLVCSLVFFMVSKLHLELKWKIVFTFFVVVAILGIFEIGEYTLDSFFNLKLQGVYLRDSEGLEKFNLLMNPLNDTMVDLVYGVLGSGIYCIVLAYSWRRKLRHNIFREK